jgi:hypothetical protein
MKVGESFIVTNAGYYDFHNARKFSSEIAKMEFTSRRVDSNTKRNILIENTSGQFVFPKAKPGQSVSYSVMATDGTILKVVTMKTKPLVPRIANAFAQKSALLTTNKKMAINAKKWCEQLSSLENSTKSWTNVFTELYK